MSTSLRSDLSRAYGRLARTPTFVVVVSMVLAMGVAANLLVYTTVRNVLLNPLPAIENPEGLLQESRLLSYSTYTELARQSAGSRSIRGLAAYRPIEVGFSPTPRHAAESAHAVLVTSNYFDVVGVEVVRGRQFQVSEARYPGAGRVAILAHDAWLAYYNANPDVIGQFVRLNGVDFEIVGIAAAGFSGTSLTQRADIFVPLTVWPALNPQFETLGLFSNPMMLAFTPLLRVGDNLTVGQANAEVNAIYERLPSSPRGTKLDFANINQVAIPAEGRALLVDTLSLLGAVALVLFVLACLTVGQLLFARHQARSREFGIRVALGASRRQLVREPLLEVGLLCSLAGLLAVAMFSAMSAAIKALPAMAALDSPNVGRVDVFTCLLTLGFILATAASCALGPVVHASRQDASSLVGQGAGAADLARFRPSWRYGFVVGQVATSVLLVACSFLLLATLRNERAANLGLDPTNVSVVRAQFDLVAYPPPRAVAFMDDLEARLTADPHVTDVAMALREPLGSNTMETHIRTMHLWEGRTVLSNIVTPNYFATLRIPLEGRGFEAKRRFQAVISRSLASDSAMWGKDSPIGQTLRVPVSLSGQIQEIAHEVVGIADDAKYLTLRDEGVPTLYLQEGTALGALAVLLVRTDVEHSRFAEIARGITAEIDAGVPVETNALESLLERHSAPSRAVATLVGGLSALAWLLAILGCYGLISQLVSGQTREFGVRMALGANRSRILTLVLGKAAYLATAGVALGLVAWLPAGQLLSSLLYGVEAIDGLVLISVCGSVLSATLAAAYVPARRATMVDPAVVLKG